MSFDIEAKKYIENIANNCNYKITQNEIDSIYKEYFEEDGIVNSLISSKIKDLIYDKKLGKNKLDIDLDR